MDEEVLWKGLSTWAAFQPRKANRRRSPGKLFCPDEASHIFEKYWNYLLCLEDRLDFASESLYCQEHMAKFSHALAAMRRRSLVPRR
jgi:hypothetical protein